jgi:pentatricopeptide repeat protein
MRNLASLISKCGKDANYRLGASLHAVAIKCANRRVLDEWNAIICMYSKCGLLDSAVKLFEEMPLRDSFSWNSLLLGCSVKQEPGFAFKYFKQMYSLKPCLCDSTTLTTILSCCAEIELLFSCYMIHSLITKIGLELEVPVGNAMITSYFQCGCPISAHKVFDQMPARNLITWTSMVSGLAKSSLFTESMVLFKDMRSCMKANYMTYSSALTACSGSKALEEGRQIHGLIVKSGFTPYLHVESALMNMYSKCGSMEDALQVFKLCKEFDDVSATVILTGFAQNEMEQKTFHFFAELVNSGVEIDTNMVSAVLGAFGSTASFAFGRQIHAISIKRRFTSSTHVCNGLVNMYSKCGDLNDAFKVFHRINNRNSVSWNSMILASARHGHASEGFHLYKSMRNESIEPTDVTFLALLQACSHTGSHKMAMEVLDSMWSSKIMPRIEHYACIVDMLGRAGFLNDAKTFIEQLTFVPKKFLWQTLLGACKIHGNIEIGKYASEQLVGEEPDSTAGYVLLGNIYSAEEMWVERGRIRNTMKRMRVRKDTGMSWIEIGKETHAFAAVSLIHPESDMIIEVIAQLIAIANDRMIMMDTDLLNYDSIYGMPLLF